ncbi:replicative DNA helicase [Paenibacillus agaridevorans]|uniref:replicative DNA helicase n=1 Tax=Paenibacillus agaridevorans TaxID=171404 RepID=UPI001BE41CF5|nr:DnaB-like helicase C-terminal domain-containing protein [Paenibacillus agaridevorans]
MGLIPFTNYETELWVVGAMLKNKDAIDTIQTIVTPDDFYFSDVKYLFVESMELHNSDRLDGRTLMQWMRQKGFEQADELIADALNAVPVPRMAKEYAEQVSMLSMKRKAMKLSQQLVELVNDTEDMDVSKFMSEVSGMVGDMDSSRGGNMVSARTYFRKYIKEKEVKKTVNSPKFGLADMDAWSRGILKKQLIVVAGRPGTGKTAFTLQVQENISSQGYGAVPVFSMEMGNDELIDRVTSNKTGIPFSKLKHNDLTAEEWKLVKAVEPKINETFYLDDKPKMDLGYITSQCRQLKRKHKQIGSIMIDYLGLMEMHKKKGETVSEATGNITKALKQLARELDTSIFLLVQMNREIEKRSAKRPVLSDLRDSGSIEQDADMVIFLHKDDEKSDAKMSHIDLIVAKGRNTGVRDFELSFLVEIQRMVTKAVIAPGAR